MRHMPIGSPSAAANSAVHTRGDAIPTMKRAGSKLSFLSPRLKPADTRRIKPPPKQRLPIYGTPEYREWRGVVIRRAGGLCQDPRHDPQRSRRASRLFADHIHELKDGGAPFDPANGMARCGSCHTRKTTAERAARRE